MSARLIESASRPFVLAVYKSDIEKAISVCGECKAACGGMNEGNGRAEVTDWGLKHLDNFVKKAKCFSKRPSL